MSGDTLIIFALIAVIAELAWVIYKLHAKNMAHEQQLIDRIMTRNYAEYIQGEVAKEQVKKEPTLEEIAAMQEERGIPI